MKYSDFKNRLFKKAKEKFEHCEIFINNASTTVVSTYNDELNKYTVSESGGVSFRGISNSMEGYAYSEDISENAIDYLIDVAYQSMEVVGEKEDIFIYKPEKEEIFSREAEVKNTDSNVKIEKILSMNKVARNLSEMVHQVDGKGVEVFEEKYIANTYGLEKYEENSYSYVYAYIILKKGEEMKSGMEFELKDTFMECDFEKIAKSAVEKAIKEFGASPVKSGKYDIILINEEVCSLLGALEPAFSAKNVHKNMSPLKGMLGSKIASEKFTMIDSKSIPETGIVESFDDEGIDKEDREIIKDGVLMTYLNNIETSKEDGVKSTANSSRSYKSTSHPSMSTMIIKEGQLNFDEMVEKMQNGLIITAIQGLHSGLNPVSGEFSVPCNGYLVENGEVKRAVNQIIMSSSLKEILTSIDEVGNDRRVTLSCSYVPSILIKGINISGL